MVLSLGHLQTVGVIKGRGGVAELAVHEAREGVLYLGSMAEPSRSRTCKPAAYTASACWGGCSGVFIRIHLHRDSGRVSACSGCGVFEVRTGIGHEQNEIFG